MDFSANRPPVIRSTLGTSPGFTPQFSIINTTTGAVETLTSTAMLQLNSTAVWYFPVASNMTIPSTYTEYEYFVSDNSGNVIDNGSYSIEDSSASTAGAIVSKDIILPSVIGIPGSIAQVKNYPIRFLPYGTDGDFLPGVTEKGASPTLGPNITITFQNGANAAFNVSGNMVLGTEEWLFTGWNIGYSTPEDILLVVIEAQVNGKEYRFTRMVETLKPRQFNPQRLSTGIVS